VIHFSNGFVVRKTEVASETIQMAADAFANSYEISIMCDSARDAEQIAQAIAAPGVELERSEYTDADGVVWSCISAFLS
jgi:hypothetical protein